MSKLRIYVDLAMPPEAATLLEAGTRQHQLVFPAQPISSVLAKGGLDAQFATADIAFGQPAVEAIAAASQLKWVQVSSAGITRYDNAPFRAMVAQRKIIVCNSSRVYEEACAVHALAFILAQARKLPLALRAPTASGTVEWNALRESSRTLRGETVLILGYGSIGRHLAGLLQPLGLKVVAYRRKARGDEAVPVITAPELPAALAQSDHIVNILPDSAETRHFCSHSFFESVQPGAIFYNIGRGGTVDQTALLAALRSKRIGAAWLDVTEPEPLPDGHPLWAEPNCFITPHVAGGKRHETQTLVRHFLDNLKLFLRGEALLDRVM